MGMGHVLQSETLSSKTARWSRRTESCSCGLCTALYEHRCVCPQLWPVNFKKRLGLQISVAFELVITGTFDTGSCSVRLPETGGVIPRAQYSVLGWLSLRLKSSLDASMRSILGR